MWQCCIISELRTVWSISNPISKELEARDFSRVSVHKEQMEYLRKYSLKNNTKKEGNNIDKTV